MLAGGYINDKFGPRFVIAAGGLFIGIGYLLCAVSESISMLYIAYGLLVGIGTGMVNGCTINCAWLNFFLTSEALPGGTVTAFLGVGAAGLPFVVNWLILRIWNFNLLARCSEYVPASLFLPADF